MGFFKYFSFPQGNINSLLSTLALKCVFWQSCQSLDKSLFMEIIKKKRSRQEACFCPGMKVEKNNLSFKRWKYLSYWGGRWNNCPLHFPHPGTYIFNQLLSKYLPNSTGGGECWQEQSFVFQSKGNKGPQKDSIRAAPPGPSTPHVLTQGLSALGSKLLNHFIRHCVPICWWEISPSFSWPQPSLPYFPLLNALLATIRHWGSGWLSLEKWKVSQPAWKVTLHFGSNSRLSAKDVFCSWRTTEILNFPPSS